MGATPNALRNIYSLRTHFFSQPPSRSSPVHNVDDSTLIAVSLILITPSILLRSAVTLAIQIGIVCGHTHAHGFVCVRADAEVKYKGSKKCGSGCIVNTSWHRLKKKIIFTRLIWFIWCSRHYALVSELRRSKKEKERESKRHTCYKQNSQANDT